MAQFQKIAATGILRDRLRHLLVFGQFGGATLEKGVITFFPTHYS